MSKGFGFTALTGGTSGCLDAIDGDLLSDLDYAVGVVGNFFYAFILDADSAAAESSPECIAPDNNAGDKRWINTGMVAYKNVFIGDTSNANMTQGLTINQGINDDEILALKSSDVAHGLTDRAETDTYGFIKKYSGANGGLRIEGLSDGDARALVLYGSVGSTDPTDTTPAIEMYAGKKNTTDVQALGAAERVLAISNAGTNILTLNGSGGMSLKDNPIRQNLLTNSGFGVWSNSTLENVGTAIWADDCADDGTADWAKTAALAFDTDHYEITTDAANEGIYKANLSFTAGKLYKVSCDMKDGTATPTDVNFEFSDGASQTSSYMNITGVFVTYTAVFRAVSTTAAGYIGIFVHTSMAGGNIEVKNFTFYEVTPGCVAADALGPDGWSKAVTLDLYREHNGVNTKGGSFYSLKSTPSAQNDYLLFPNTIFGNAEWYSKFLGRTVTFGMWVKSSTASDFRLGIASGIGGGTVTYSSYHTGGGDWEWLETTQTVALTTTTFYVAYWHSNVSPGVAYISQPMLCYGSSIGEGNYVPVPGEVVRLESPITLASWDGDDVPASGSNTINLETESNGKIPKGTKAISGIFDAKNTAAAKYLIMVDASTLAGSMIGFVYSQVANQYNVGFIDGQCDSSENIYLNAEDANWSAVRIRLHRVQVN